LLEKHEIEDSKSLVISSYLKDASRLRSVACLLFCQDWRHCSKTHANRFDMFQNSSQPWLSLGDVNARERNYIRAAMS
jgi:hypothetical protein